jgi:hypothetical protein
LIVAVGLDHQTKSDNWQVLGQSRRDQIDTATPRRFAMLRTCSANSADTLAVKVRAVGLARLSRERQDQHDAARAERHCRDDGSGGSPVEIDLLGVLHPVLSPASRPGVAAHPALFMFALYVIVLPSMVLVIAR